MKLEKQVCSLELAKKLKSLSYPQEGLTLEETVEELTNLLKQQEQEIREGVLKNFRTWLIRTYGEGNNQMESDKVIEQYINQKQEEDK